MLGLEEAQWPCVLLVLPAFSLYTSSQRLSADRIGCTEEKKKRPKKDEGRGKGAGTGGIYVQFDCK